MPYTLYDYIYTSREGLKHAVCVIRRSHGETTEEMIKYKTMHRLGIHTM
jgi:hypothetical protein